MATKKSSNIKGSKQPQNTKSGRWGGRGFPFGERHPKAIDLRKRERDLQRFPLGTLVVLVGTIRRVERSRLVIDVTCTACEKRQTLLVDNLWAKKTTNCRCQRAKKYFDPRSETLGMRYDTMIQRCERDTHVSSNRYKGRGIQVLFKSREEFIRWALKKYPNSDFKELVFDRRNNDGNYSKGNLRLTTYSVNNRNRLRSTI